MTASLAYRVFLDGDPLGLDTLATIDTVTVDQAMDAPWEAEVVFLAYTSAKGIWLADTKAEFGDKKRLRVEVRVAGTWVPLFDGPIVGERADLSSEPGVSTRSLIARDDTVLLNHRQPKPPLQFKGLRDDEIAGKLFARVAAIGKHTKLEQTKQAKKERQIVGLGTEMDLLRRLVAWNTNYHAWVVPGPKAGETCGCFKPHEIKPSFPPLIMTGNKRNIDAFQVRADYSGVATATGSAFAVGKKSVVTRSSTFEREDVLGPKDPVEEKDAGTVRLAPDEQVGCADLDEALKAKQARLRRSLTAEGSVRGGCLDAALEPYRSIAVEGAGPRLSGVWLVTRARHVLGRSEYTQDFACATDAISAGTTKQPGIAQGIF
jgi:hypothetical protein